jgi:hypothetical protein
VLGEARYRTVSELMSDFAYSFRVEPVGAIAAEWVAGALEPITGFSMEELKSRGGWETLIHPEDLPFVMRQLKGQRAKDMVRQILAFSRQGDLLEVVLRRERIAPGGPEGAAHLPSGTYVRLSVRDNGRRSARWPVAGSWAHPVRGRRAGAGRNRLEDDAASGLRSREPLEQRGGAGAFQVGSRP